MFNVCPLVACELKLFNAKCRCSIDLWWEYWFSSGYLEDTWKVNAIHGQPWAQLRMKMSVSVCSLILLLNGLLKSDMGSIPGLCTFSDPFIYCRDVTQIREIGLTGSLVHTGMV